MSNRTWPFLLILIVLLAACGQAPAASPTPTIRPGAPYGTPIAQTGGGIIYGTPAPTATPVIIRETVVVQQVVTATPEPAATSMPSPTAMPIYGAPSETAFAGSHFDGIELVTRFGSTEWVLINTEFPGYFEFGCLSAGTYTIEVFASFTPPGSTTPIEFNNSWDFHYADAETYREARVETNSLTVWDWYIAYR